jgi:hypothetical protein
VGCGGCAEKAKARLAAQQAKGKSTGKWSVTLLSGERQFFDNKLAAMAWNIDNGGDGMIRSVSE